MEYYLHPPSERNRTMKYKLTTFTLSFSARNVLLHPRAPTLALNYGKIHDLIYGASDILPEIKKKVADRFRGNLNAF